MSNYYVSKYEDTEIEAILDTVANAITTNITSEHSVASTERIIIADAATASYAVNLIAVADAPNFTLTIKKSDSTSNQVNITPASGEQIEDYGAGVALPLKGQWQFVTLVPDEDNSRYIIVAQG